MRMRPHPYSVVHAYIMPGFTSCSAFIMLAISVSMLPCAHANAAGAKAALSSQEAATACKILYRLAHMADEQYRGLLAQRQSPEYETETRLIEVSQPALA